MPQLDFAEVTGLQALVRCSLFDVRIRYQNIGDDPSLVDPVPTPVPARSVVATGPSRTVTAPGTLAPDRSWWR